ncbi:Tyrosine-protein kinase Wzc [hydrothermal vent metagenome]|uniref:non-specific protein-tyrosine kinase n=1 Tax=hydrothermal vent metagenome TaxID=652676 RepID=A0A3B0W5M2_9ZZZZ
MTESNQVNYNNDKIFDLKDFVILVKKHWMIILSMVIISSLFLLYLAIKAKPVYQSSASLMIDRPTRMSSLDQFFGMMGMDREFYPNQIHLLRSHPVARRVVQRIGVDKFLAKERELKWYEKLIPGQAAQDYSQKSADELFAMAVANVRDTLSVSQVKGSGVFNIAFDDYDPFLATLKANALAESYIEEVIESGINAKQRTGESIAKQLPELEKKVTASEQALQAFQKQHKIFLPEGGDELAVQELGQKSARINELKRDKLSLESVYRRIKSVASQPDKLARISALLKKPEVINQKGNFAKAQSLVSELGLIYGSKHPKMKRAVETKRLAQIEYYSILQTTADSIIADYDSIVQEIIYEERGFSSIKGEITSNNELAFEYDALKRDYDYNKQIYSAFLKQSKETDAVKTASVQTINAKVTNKAILPTSPYKPNKKIMLLIGLMVGLLLGLGLAFLLEHFDNTFKSSEEVENKLDVPVIGMIPNISEKDSDVSPALQFIEAPKSAFAESIRTLRTGVLLSLPDHEHKSILVTSTVPSEGKTTIAMNLAHSLSHLGDTILVEADLRRPMVKKNMGSKNQTGLSSLITGESTFANSIVVDIRSKKLHILSSGLIPPNPLELLSSEKFEALLDQLKEKYKFVIIDCAPVMAVSDALVLSQKVDGVLFVIKHESTPSQLVESAVTRLKRISAKVIGVTLNRLKTNKVRYGRYYKYEGNYYGHYGYNSSSKDTSQRSA